jgi:hypothetical protein
MEKLIKRISNGIIIVLAAVAVIAGLIVAFTFKEGTMPKGLDASFVVIYILLCVSIALIVCFAIAQMLSSKKQIVRTLVLLAVCAVIVLVSYFVAPKELSDVAVRIGVSEGVYQWVGAALNIAYIAFFGVVLAFIGSLVYIKIKN